MITECLRFLKGNPAYGKEQIGSLDLLIVDEYQDFNPTERSLLDQISSFAAETTGYRAALAQVRRTGLPAMTSATGGLDA